jgi:two-component system, OmpR family, sensor histidine kinase KdpD
VILPAVNVLVSRTADFQAASAGTQVRSEEESDFTAVVQIDQVLTNLIENAVKFSPAGSPIAVSVVGHPKGVRVTVSDRGPGISKDDRAHIFEPFETGRERQAGTGLGLAIARAIVDAHGGRVWVSDVPGGGAAFTFELPCLDTPSTSEVSGDVGTDSRR